MPTGTIIIPTTQEDSEYVIEAAKQHFAERFGGYSAYEGSGGWYNDEGELIEESHMRLESTHHKILPLRVSFYTIAKEVKRFCDEDEVYVEFSNAEVNFV